MARPNKTREVFAEAHLAERIALERERRGWTNDGLAKRMTDAGCSLTGSAIFKIEKGEPRRRIVVDELVAFAKVFGLTVEDLLLPPTVALHREIAALVATVVAKDAAFGAALDEKVEADRQLSEALRRNRGLEPAVVDLLTEMLPGSLEVRSRRAKALANAALHPYVEDSDYKGPGRRYRKLED